MDQTPKFKANAALRLAAPLDFELKTAGSGRIEGYASTFGGEPDSYGDVISPGAFTRTLREHQQQKTSPVMLWAHKQETPIGKWLRIEEDSTGLFVAGQVNLNTEKGREAFEHIRAGDVTGFSIGWVEPEGARRYVANGIFAVDEVDLVEISVVGIPANKRARITQAKQLGSKAEAVSFLRDAGLSKAAANRFAAGGYAALSNETINSDVLAKLAAEIDRATLQFRNTK